MDKNLAGWKVKLLPALAWAMGVSVVLNLALGAAYLSARDTATKATTQRDAAQRDAADCSKATDALQKLAEKRKREVETARAAAAKSANAYNQRADATLARQPKDAANSCASLQELGDEWLAGRVQK